MWQRLRSKTWSLMKILLVDDNDAVRKALRHELERRGFDICDEAMDGIQAIAKAKKLKPDLILLDRSMPELGGASIAPVLRKEMPGVAIILMTLHVEAVDSYATDELGVDVVCAKSDGLENLLYHIDRLLAFRSKASPRIVG